MFKLLKEIQPCLDKSVIEKLRFPNCYNISSFLLHSQLEHFVMMFVADDSFTCETENMFNCSDF